MPTTLTTEDIALLRDTLIAPLESRLDLKLASVQSEVAGVKSDVASVKSELGNQISALADRTGDLTDRTARLERGVNAIKTRPVPYGKPKGFFTAPVYEPGYGMRRGKVGYQG